MGKLSLKEAASIIQVHFSTTQDAYPSDWQPRPPFRLSQPFFLAHFQTTESLGSITASQIVTSRTATNASIIRECHRSLNSCVHVFFFCIGSHVYKNVCAGAFVYMVWYTCVPVCVCMLVHVLVCACVGDASVYFGCLSSRTVHRKF